MPALQSGCYEITWEWCAELPSPMYYVSAVLLDEKVYIMAGCASDDDILFHVYCYDSCTYEWEQLPSHKHIQGILQVINDYLTIIGGWDVNANMATNNVSTLINNSWTDHYPNLLKARCKPGVASHSEYVIVAGGGEGERGSDDIEILNTKTPSQWMMTSILLPEPMWSFSFTISDNNILIVGYTTDVRLATSYQLPVNVITSSCTPAPITDQWVELPSTPHYNCTTIPNSNPPVIMGGRGHQGLPTSDVAILDDSSKSWKKVSSLSSPRYCVAVVPIDSNTILVLGGCTGGENVAGARENCITTVEKGRVILTQRAGVPGHSV